MQAVQKDLMDMLVKELKEELEARDQRQRPAQQGMAAPERLHTARSWFVRARILQSLRATLNELFLPF